MLNNSLLVRFLPGKRKSELICTGSGANIRVFMQAKLHVVRIGAGTPPCLRARIRTPHGMRML